MNTNRYTTLIVVAAMLGMATLGIASAYNGRVEFGEQPDAVGAQLYALDHDRGASQVGQVQQYTARTTVRF